MIRRSVVSGTGSCLPQRKVSNAGLVEEKGIDSSDGWITQRTGIRCRHVAEECLLTSDLALMAAQRALAAAGMEAGQIDLIILATTTPDHTFPATAVRVQAALGLTHGVAFDVQAVCAGFLYALTLADTMIRSGQAKHALVIGAETMTRLLDWSDRSTCVLFGDGAGAVVLSLSEGGEGTSADRGVLATRLRSDGRHYDLLRVDGGPSSTGTTGYIRMQGPEVFRIAVSCLSEILVEILESSLVSIEDIDWLVPHQANKRIIEAVAKRLGISIDKIILTLENHGNTSAASIPLALDVAVADGRIERGQLIALEAIGGGFAWGAGLIRW